VRLELERSNNAEISASTPQCPEQIVVFRSAGSQYLSVGSHNLRRQQIVNRHPIFTNELANSTPKRQATYTSFGHNPARDCEPEHMRFSIDVTKSCSALYSNCTGLVIYEDGPHSAKVDYQTVVAERTTAYVVSAATNRRDQTIRTSEMDRCNNVRDARALAIIFGCLLTLAFQILRASL
jgi:hypothetical protein